MKNQLFKELLKAYKKCEDITNYVRLEKTEVEHILHELPVIRAKKAESEVLLCEGEMFAPNGIYGQIILSNGAIEVFKNTIAPASGWNCN